MFCSPEEEKVEPKGFRESIVDGISSAFGGGEEKDGDSGEEEGEEEGAVPEEVEEETPE